MRTLIEDYNAFAEEITNSINVHDAETEEKLRQFEIEFSQKFQDFIDTIELEIEHASDTEIANITAKFDELHAELDEAIANVQTVQGKSAYEVACDNGFEGSESEWVESLKGDSIPTFTIDAGSNLNTNTFAKLIFPEITSISVNKTRRIRLKFTNNVSSSSGIEITAPTTPYNAFASSTLYIKEAELDVVWCGMDGGGPEKYSLLFTLMFYGSTYAYRIAFGDNDNPVQSITGNLVFTKVS